MKIQQIKPYRVSVPLRQPFAFSQWSYDRRSVCLVQVVAEDGTDGWGEGYGPAAAVYAGIEWLAQFATGADALANGRLWENLHRRCLDYARSGVLTASLSAIDNALWDLKGKLLGQPVHVLLGGKRRDKVKVYATGMYFTEGGRLAQRLADEARDYEQQGFLAMKMKVGLSIPEDLRHVRAVRAAISENTGLMVDSNHAYSLREARELSRALEDHRLDWFEEPLSPDDYEGYQSLRQGTSIPLAAGECEYGVHGFRRLFENRCVDYAQPDLGAAGGLTEGQRIAALARAHHVEMAPHCWGTGIAFATALHFVATLDPTPGRAQPPEPILEMDRTESLLRDDLIVPAFRAEAGYVTVPDAPGLGVTVRPEQLERFGRS